jgi:4-amino-4-deoxy-L-arabinose transferase-like glycosyltransferase
MLEKIKKYISQHKVEISLLLLILFVAAFFRIYRISDYMTFLGDEGRDAIVAKNILHGNFTLLGPRASAGDFFLGPIYYYMMAPFLLMSNYDPVGPAIMVAIFGVATVFLVYYVGLKFFNAKAGLIAASLYAISPLVIAYSRSSWNPNVMPFFSIVMLYVLYVSIKKQSRKLFLLVGLLLGIAMQLHYLSTFLAVIVFFFVLLGERMLDKNNFVKRCYIHYIEIFIGFIVGLSPFLAFEVRHGFPNIRTIFKFIFEDNAAKGYEIHHSFFGNIWDVSFRLFGRLVTKFPPPDQINVGLHTNLQIWFVGTVLLAIFSIFALKYVKEKLKVLLLALWLFFGILLFGFYKKSIYDYYLGFMFPVPFLLVGGLLSHLTELKKFKWMSIVAGVIFVTLVAINLSGNPFRYQGNRQKDQARHIAEAVLAQTGGKPFNFALLTKGNSDHVYRYFFEIENRAPVTIQNIIVDPERKSVTDQLMVVCEDLDCHPLGNSLWEVSGFGRAEITGEWSVPFVKIFRLVHYKEPEATPTPKVYNQPHATK